MTAISYGVTGNVAATPNVAFGYDQAGNRTLMDDGPGTVTYNYNLLSELTSEARVFDQPGDPGGSFTLSYEYNLAGQVKKVTDPWNNSVSYALNKTGEATGITGTGFADINQWTNRIVSNFATGIKYRAWGDLKEFTSGNFATNRAAFSMQYDTSMRLTRFEGGGRVTEHDYYADGRVKEVRSPDNNDYKRTYSFDQAARLITANAFKTPTAPNDPYAFTFGYDAWGNTTARTGTRWNTALPNFTAAWTNGRNTNSTHDAAGNQTATTPGATTQTQQYDAAGRPSSNTVQAAVFSSIVDSVSYDGDGRVVRRVAETRIGAGPFSTSKRHFVRSSVLGGAVIGEVQDNGSSLGSDPNRFESRTYMYLNGERIAYQKYADRTSADKEVVWVYKHPLIGTLLETNKLNHDIPGQGVQPLEYYYGLGYFDPLGADLGYDPATQPPPVQVDDPLAQLQFGDVTNYSSGCVMDGVRTNCNIVQSALNNGWAAEAPWGVSGLTWNTKSQVWQSAEGFVADWDSGYFGFIPQGAIYAGNGTWVPSKPRPTLNPPGTYESKHGHGFSPEPEPQPARKKHNHNFVPWVVRDVRKLERIIQDDDRQGRTVARWTDGNHVTNCASLPMKWDFDNARPIEQMRHPEQGVWQMGVAITPVTVRGLTRGTVIATFDRDSGVYLNETSGNHTAIFLSYYGETDRRGNFTVKGIWVLEQGPRWPTRGRQIPFDPSAQYHSDAGRFNVVKICESHNPKLPFK